MYICTYVHEVWNTCLGASHKVCMKVSLSVINPGAHSSGWMRRNSIYKLITELSTLKDIFGGKIGRA